MKDRNQNSLNFLSHDYALRFNDMPQIVNLDMSRHDTIRFKKLLENTIKIKKCVNPFGRTLYFFLRSKRHAITLKAGTRQKGKGKEKDKFKKQQIVNHSQSHKSIAQ